MKKGEKGYTLIELIIAITILAVAVAAAGGGIYQIIRNTERNGNHMVAVLQVQNAGNKITEDVQTAQNITTMEELTDPDFLIVSWVNGVSGDVYEVTYTLEDAASGSLKELWRTQSINDTGNITSLVAQHINYSDDLTSCNFSSGMFNLTVTATIGSGPMMESETRIYRIFPRPG